jgi:hypothetical protein
MPQIRPYLSILFLAAVFEPSTLGLIVECYASVLTLLNISHKQSARAQRLSWSKASAFFSLQKIVSCMKCNNLYPGLVAPSRG